MKDADTNTVTEVSTVFTTSDKHQKTVESGLPLVHTTMVLRGEKHKHQWITVMYSSPLVFLLYQRWPAETVISPACVVISCLGDGERPSLGAHSGIGGGSVKKIEQTRVSHTSRDKLATAVLVKKKN